VRADHDHRLSRAFAAVSSYENGGPAVDDPTIMEATMPGLIDEVREGMTVRDSTGAEIGSVSLVKLSDPGVVTPEGQDTDAQTGIPVVPVTPAAGVGTSSPGVGGTPLGVGGIFAVGAVGGTEPDVPDEFADRLRRTGYVKIGKGLFRHDLYVGADQIDRVTTDEVTLTTDKDHLVRET
jgi:hypothetical protein